MRLYSHGVLLRLVVSLFVVLAVGVPSASAQRLNREGSTGEGPQSLADAVRTFNSKAKNDPIGKDQRPLTEEEVIASIRAIGRDAYPSMTDEAYEALQEIADTRVLPDNAEISFTQGLRNKDYDIKVWWVDLAVVTDPQERWPQKGSGIRIRDQKISSRLAKDVDRERFQQQYEALQKRGTRAPSERQGKDN